MREKSLVFVNEKIAGSKRRQKASLTLIKVEEKKTKVDFKKKHTIFDTFKNNKRQKK